LLIDIKSKKNEKCFELIFFERDENKKKGKGEGEGEEVITMILPVKIFHGINSISNNF
jgi:hypothetical protein